MKRTPKIKTKEFPSSTNLHNAIKEDIKSFLNTNSEKLGSIDKLGAFVDDIEIIKEVGVKGKLKYLIIECTEYEHLQSGEKFTKNNTTTNVFEKPFNLPEDFPEEPLSENYVLLSTVQTFECNPSAQCTKCNGNGRCVPCEARGYNNCSSCKGSGSGKTSDGRLANGNIKYKKINCYSCHGQKTKPCTICEGAKKCYYCSGNGKVICDKCDGTSFYQKMKAYKTTWKTKSSIFYISEFPEIKTVLAQSNGETAYDDELIEWSNEKDILFDNRVNLGQINNQMPKVSKELGVIELETNERVGRVYAFIESIPITVVKYNFEDKEYKIFITGNNNLVSFYEIPKKHHFKASIITRFFNLFNKTKRRVAFLYLASFMFNSDDHLDDSEIQLLEILLENIKLKTDRKKEVLSDISKKMNFEDVSQAIKVLKNDKRALIFAWHCVIQDEEVKDSEILAFNQLVKFFKLKEKDVNNIKIKAKKFSELSPTEMLEEYFN